MLHSEPHRSLQRESYCWSLVVGLRKSLWSSENVTNAQSRRRKLVEEGDEEEGVWCIQQSIPFHIYIIWASPKFSWLRSLGSQNWRRNWCFPPAQTRHIPGGLCLWVLEMTMGEQRSSSLVTRNSFCCQAQSMFPHTWERSPSKSDNTSQRPQKELFSKENARLGTNNAT